MRLPVSILKKQRKTMKDNTENLPQSVENGNHIGKIAEELSKLDKDQVSELFSRLEEPVVQKVTAVFHSEFRGPLPPPHLLKEYNDITPGLADRIIGMAESNQAHAQEINKTALDGAIKRDSRGQIFGFLIGLAGLAAATTCAYFDQAWPATIIGGTTLVALVSVFLIGHKDKD